MNPQLSIQEETSQPTESRHHTLLDEAESLLEIQSTADLARHLGVSRWTVSRVLNGHPGVSAKTRKEVESAIERLGFRPNLLGRALRGASTGLVGVSFQELESPIRAKKVSVLQELMRGHGLRAVMEISSGDTEQEAAIIEDFLSLRVDGIILFGSLLDATHPVFEKIRREGCRLLSIDPIASAPGACLRLDRASAMRDVLERLLLLGHRRFALLGMGHDPLYGPPRLAGLRAEAKRHNLPFEDHFTSWDLPGSTDLTYLAGAQLIEKMFVEDRGFQATALLALNDCHAIGALHALRKRGFRVPEDFSLVGFDDISVSAWVHPGLTTVSQRPEAFMEAVLQEYARANAQNANGPHEDQTRIFKAEFVLRDSVNIPRHEELVVQRK